MAIDPICKMEVDENRAKYGSTYKGKKFYFCSARCKKKFDEDPEKHSSMTQDIGETPGKCCD